MKYIKLFEVKFKSPGLRHGNVGTYLYDKFFLNKDIEEIVESEDPDKIEDISYQITFIFEYQITGDFLDIFTEMKNYLIENFNLKEKNTSLYPSHYANKINFNISIKGLDNVDKLKKEADIHVKLKKYNL
jgi:hypothetical protein